MRIDMESYELKIEELQNNNTLKTEKLKDT